MITKENFKEVVESITKEEFDTAINNSGDYICMILHIANVGFSVAITSENYNEELEEACQAEGDLFCDKNEFLRLVNEVTDKFKED